MSTMEDAMMSKLTSSLLFLIALLAGLPCAHANSTSDNGAAPSAQLSVELGRNDFMNYCATCHGVEGKGNGTVAEFLTIPAADLTQLRKKNAGTFPRERVTEVIDGRIEVKVHGLRDMPVWGEWFKQEAATSGAPKVTQEDIVGARIRALVGYIETIQGN